MSGCAAIILAAGESSRFGKPKQLIEIDRKPLVRRIVDAAAEANCCPIIVVAGAHEPALRKALEISNAIVVKNENWQCGIGTSIRAGVQHLIENKFDIDSVVLLLCDQPFVDAATIRELIVQRKLTKKNIVASKYADSLGVPVLFDSCFFLDLLSLPAEAGAKSVVLNHRSHVAEFVFPQGAIDIDTPEDWKKLRGGSAYPNTMAKESDAGLE